MNPKQIGIFALMGGVLGYFMPDVVETFKSETLPTTYAVAVMAPNDNGVDGVVRFRDTGKGVEIKYNITDSMNHQSDTYKSKYYK